MHLDRKSTRLNSSHDQISYAVFCLKKKKKNEVATQINERKKQNIHIRLVGNRVILVVFFDSDSGLVFVRLRFFFKDTATTEIYTLSLHDALPICFMKMTIPPILERSRASNGFERTPEDRKSTRLNSSHDQISYAVFCLKKKKTINNTLLVKKKKRQKKT